MVHLPKFSFYVNEQDTVFIMRPKKVYLLPRELPYYDSKSLPLTHNLYAASKFVLDGKIRTVCPIAGDASKIYLIYTKIEGGSVSFVAFELAASRDALDRGATIRLLFSFSSALEWAYFKLNAS